MSRLGTCSWLLHFGRRKLCVGQLICYCSYRAQAYESPGFRQVTAIRPVYLQYILLRGVDALWQVFFQNKWHRGPGLRARGARNVS